MSQSEQSSQGVIPPLPADINEPSGNVNQGGANGSDSGGKVQHGPKSDPVGLPGDARSAVTSAELASDSASAEQTDSGGHSSDSTAELECAHVGAPGTSGDVEPRLSVSLDKKTGEGGGYINMDAGATSQEPLAGFNKLLVITELVGIALIAMVATWCGYHRGGFAWRSNPELQFNLHPLLTVLTMVFLTANSMLTYRVLRSNRKSLLKLIHGGLHLIGFPVLVVGVVSAFDYHNLTAKPNLYSLHSWVGLGALILYAIQWVFAFITFFFPGLKAEVRTVALPLHVFSGMSVFIMSVAACLLGLNEKAIFALGLAGYPLLPSEAVLINMIGIVLVVFALLVGYMVSKPEYKRSPRPEDGSPLLAASSQRQ